MYIPIHDEQTRKENDIKVREAVISDSRLVDLDIDSGVCYPDSIIFWSSSELSGRVNTRYRGQRFTHDVQPIMHLAVRRSAAQKPLLTNVIRSRNTMRDILIGLGIDPSPSTITFCSPSVINARVNTLYQGQSHTHDVSLIPQLRVRSSDSSSREIPIMDQSKPDMRP